MNRSLALITVALATSVLSGCAVPLVMGANLAVMSFGNKAVVERKAGKCYDIEVAADKNKLGPAEKRYELAKAGCASQ